MEHFEDFLADGMCPEGTDDCVAGMTGEDGREISRLDLEWDQMEADADEQYQLMEDEFGE